VKCCGLWFDVVWSRAPRESGAASVFQTTGHRGIEARGAGVCVCLVFRTKALYFLENGCDAVTECSGETSW
jgi:hypothetical protein